MYVAVNTNEIDLTLAKSLGWSDVTANQIDCRRFVALLLACSVPLKQSVNKFTKMYRPSGHPIVKGNQTKYGQK